MKLVENTKTPRGRIFLINHMTEDEVNKIIEFIKGDMIHKNKEYVSEDYLIEKNNGKHVVVTEHLVSHFEKYVAFEVYDNLTKNKDRFSGILELGIGIKESVEVTKQFKELAKN